MMWAMPGTHGKDGGEEESEPEPRTPEHLACSLPLYTFPRGILLSPLHWLRWGQEAGDCGCVLNPFSLV